MEVKVYHFDTVLKMVTALLTIIPMEPWTNKDHLKKLPCGDIGVQEFLKKTERRPMSPCLIPLQYPYRLNGHGKPLEEDSKENDENFRAALRFRIGAGDEIFLKKKHLKNHPGKVSYISP
ncbi:hypothetical protein AVEN_94355-1 [Araneus ventricosus]|uniref:Uncharacterized protein n=1 Tax=Araneus ventricosus TaxID=182803 RepID=A0A4Y2E9T2_ARAVE|nr:hypothetical protein AVEN_94355-1 [Araneus ventricosus]